MSELHFPTWPQFSEDEIAAASEVLRSGKVNYWTGEQVKLFETEFANYLGAEYAVAVANGTLALELALHALEIQPGDEVIVPSCTFIATASAVVARGATPVVADIEIDSLNISIDTIKPHITSKTKAIIVVHLAGYPCDMDAIMQFARQHNLYVIEDCAQAHGAKYKNQYVGTFGDIAAFSFCQDKIMTTGGEGGMVVTNNQTLYQRAWSYKDHGKDFDLVFNKKTHEPGYRWLHTDFGTNWRMTEMQAAIGRVQLNKLNDWVAKRRENAAMLNEHFSLIPQLKTIAPHEDYYHAYYKYYVFLNLEELNKDINKKINKQNIIDALTEQGIPAFSGICPEIYLEKAFENHPHVKIPTDRYPNAKIIADTSLMLLVHPTLDSSHIRTIASILQQSIDLSS